MYNPYNPAIVPINGIQPKINAGVDDNAKAVVTWSNFASIPRIFEEINNIADPMKKAIIKNIITKPKIIKDVMPANKGKGRNIKKIPLPIPIKTLNNPEKIRDKIT
jgi:hypothetical protein